MTPTGMMDEDTSVTTRRLGMGLLCLCAVVVGIVTGLGAVVFRDLIGLVHNVLFLGRFSVSYDASVYTPASAWGVFVILVPVIGGLGVTWLVSNFAPEAKGHGVPEVMDAIFYKNGVIRPAVAVVKSLASALAIGSGAAVGREGPIIQIGSALGSTLGQRIRMSAGQRIVLIAAGAGSGIAATFNTPIGGVLFATELMLPEVSVDTFLPVALATGTATHVGRLFFGTAPAFTIPADLMLSSSRPAMVSTLLLYAALGVLVGVAAALFIHGLHLAEDLFDRIGGAYRRHALGMLMIGAALYVFYAAAGHYYIEGVGYATIQAVLARHLDGAGFLLLLFVAKLAATSISLGSGSSGGVFSPSLFMGTALGAGFAAVARAIDPGADISLPAFAMVGMGAMVGSGTGAAMTAVAMIFEMTRDYDIVLPMIIAVAVALGTRRLLSAETLYSGKLAKRGHPVPKAMHANMFLVRNVAELMEADFLVLDAAAPVASLRGRGSARHAVLVERDRVVGVLPIDAALGRAAGRDEAAVALSSLATDRFVVVDDGKAVFDAIDRMEHGRAAIAVVIGRDRGPVGLLTSELIADAVGASIRLYPR